MRHGDGVLTRSLAYLAGTHSAIESDRYGGVDVLGTAQGPTRLSRAHVKLLEKPADNRPLRRRDGLDRRRTLHVELFAECLPFDDARYLLCSLDTGLKPKAIGHACFDCKFSPRLEPEFLLTLKQHIVHGFKAALFAGALHYSRGRLGEAVHGKWKVHVRQRDLSGIAFAQFPHILVKHCAKRTFEVGKLDELHRRVSSSQPNAICYVALPGFC